MNDLQIFKSDQFGEIRTAEEGGRRGAVLRKRCS